ncbi:MAG TPA: DUF692 family protein, partial [Myxococcota bacterium]
MSSIGVGFALQPDRVFLDACAPLLALVDYVEVAPETMWRPADDGAVVDNGFHTRFVSLAAARDLPFVAHGVALSLGSDDDAAALAHHALWLKRVAHMHARLRFRWYSDHSGATILGGEGVQLPLPVPMTETRAALVRGRLMGVRDVVGRAALETSALPFQLGDPLDEPAFLARCVDAPGLHLVLDLHNVVVMAENLAFDARAYVAGLPLERVIEIHVAGGRVSDPGWLPEGKTVRLDGHDDAVPPLVWSLLDEVLPRCPQLRGVTLERREGTIFSDDDVALMRD